MPEMTEPRFIVLEGIDGSGKSTQARRLCSALCEAGEDAALTCEPTHNEIGALLRRFLRGELSCDARAVTALFAADRVDHITRSDGLLSQLKAGRTVVCDRYYFSSYAYQGCECTLERVIALNEDAAALLRPSLTVFIDIPVQLSLERIEKRGEPTERFERRERLNITRELYLRAFALTKDTERVAIVDGVGSEDEVARRVLRAVRENIG